MQPQNNRNFASTLKLARRCRFCAAPLTHTFVDLGTSPLCQKHVEPEDFNKAEAIYPLHAFVCGSCFLVQLEEFVTPEGIFADNYAYFSSFSDSWLDHARRYVESVVPRFGLNQNSFVVELASNDGYLLKNFVARKIPCLGIEPAGNCAEAAMKIGVPTQVKFFGETTAREVIASHTRVDLIIGNNVLAHVPDLNDFVAGMKLLLAPEGTITLEFPHLQKLIAENQFDTIYHEHFSYFSFCTVEKVFAHHGLTIFDVDELPTHGGSLRIYARHDGAAVTTPITPRVSQLRQCEIDAGFQQLDIYTRFGQRVIETKRRLLDFLIDAKRAGKSIAGYGAPGKGNTLLNYCGIRTDFLDYTVDRSPHKQGRYLPGTRIPIVHPDRIHQTRPDYLLILPWNLREEIMKQQSTLRDWGGKFVTPIPEVRVWD